jgi:D-alanine-D-alanine ligase
MARLRVGVVFGGRSVEHDVSIVTAHQAMAELAARYDVVPIYITREGRWLSDDALNDLSVYSDERWNDVGEQAFIPPVTGYGGLFVPGGRLRGHRRVPLDVALLCTHGTFGEDGTLQGLLELAGIPYTGSGVMGSAVGMDKVTMKAAFAAAGLPVVPHYLLDVDALEASADSVLSDAEESIGYPAFVKPARLGSSVGIGKATDRQSLLDTLEVARRYDRRILVERSMEGCVEINCAILGGPGREPRASVCEQPVAWEEFLTFSDKYLREPDAAKHDAASPAAAKGMAGQDRLIPAPLPAALTARVQENARRAFTAIDASGVARVDAFVDVDGEETWVMEINTIPGSLSFYLWEPSGVGFDELLDELVDIALQRSARAAELLFSFDSGMLRRASRRAKVSG